MKHYLENNIKIDIVRMSISLFKKEEIIEMKKVKYLVKKSFSEDTIKRIKYFIQPVQVLGEHSWILFGKIIRIFNKPKFPDKEKFGVNLHLGCGIVNHKAFINIDGFPFSHVHYVRDISNLSVFEDNSVDLIYASHCLEHFQYNNVSDVLREWGRVLKKGGTLRLSVPDFDLLLKIYYANDMNPDFIIPQLLGGQNNKYNYHYMVFNKQNLKSKLLDIGFEDIEEWVPNTNEMTTFDDFSNYFKEIGEMKYPVSLNLEARKK